MCKMSLEIKWKICLRSHICSFQILWIPSCLAFMIPVGVCFFFLAILLENYHKVDIPRSLWASRKERIPESSTVFLHLSSISETFSTCDPWMPEKSNSGGYYQKALRLLPCLVWNSSLVIACLETFNCCPSFHDLSPLVTEGRIWVKVEEHIY